MSVIFHTTMHFAFEKQRQSVDYDFSSNLSNSYETQCSICD